ncbi:hypothetical protein HYX16_02065 [Candidatus Woesearchaeota archaeon]|nr:hypothetical protein [Candidatus Woesearchaeota archaeon]
MPLERNNLEIIKNIKDLEYNKLLYEYNAWLFASFTIVLGLLGFMYSVTNNLIFSSGLSLFTLFIIANRIDEKSEELNKKVSEIKSLSKYA